MAAIIGFGFLLLIIANCLFIPSLIFLANKKVIFCNQSNELLKIIRILTFLGVILAFFAQLSLIYCYVVSDYSVANVYYNSHHLKPLIYKISGSWGNHEGSMLLLISILSCYSAAFAYFSKADDRTKIITLCVQSLILLEIVAYTALASNPFLRLFPAPITGLGLNPILQDIGLAMHPPILYLGYIGFSLIFSFTISGLITGRIDKEFAAKIKNWLFFTWGFLTLGIGLGSWWAYRELGWGGYWFWDPVENISLMPWLAGATLIHSIKLLEKKETFKIWTSLLAITSFVLCLIGIFLVRSGILTSIHAFAVDVKRGLFIILLILTIGGVGFLVFGLNARKIKSHNRLKVGLWSKIGMILFNNYFLTLALFIVLLGTLYPIFSQLFFDNSISVAASYYNQIFKIIIIPFLTLMIFSYDLDYFKNNGYLKSFNRKNLFLFLLALFISLAVFYLANELGFLEKIIFFLSISSLLFVANYAKAQINKKTFGQILNGLPVIFGHLGFSLIIIGIIFSSYFGITKEVNIKKDQMIMVKNYQIKFDDVEYIQGKNYLARQGKFSILENNKFMAILKPQLRYYPVSDQTTYEAAVKNGIFGDLYLVLGNKDDDEFYALRVYYKPMIYLIWLGCFMIFAASFIKIISGVRYFAPKR
jgi:cytochrome c-type biogenesis protein CcmF